MMVWNDFMLEEETDKTNAWKVGEGQDYHLHFLKVMPYSYV